MTDECELKPAKQLLGEKFYNDFCEHCKKSLDADNRARCPGCYDKEMCISCQHCSGCGYCMKAASSLMRGNGHCDFCDVIASKT